MALLKRKRIGNQYVGDAENDRGHWIRGAIKHPGAFTAMAHRAGESVGAYAREKEHAGGLVGRRARLALILRRIAKHRAGK